MKRHMTKQEEFDIMKLVLDKFLWLGVGIMAYAFYRLVNSTTTLGHGLLIMAAGAIILIIFMALLMREFNFMK